jgi:hypothetical protein
MPTPPARWRQDENRPFYVGIEHQIQVLVFLPANQTRQAFLAGIQPIWAVSARTEPSDVLVGIEGFPAENRVGSAKGEHAASEPKQILILPKQ